MAQPRTRGSQGAGVQQPRRTNRVHGRPWAKGRSCGAEGGDRTKKVKIATESPPRPGSIIIEEDQRNIMILMRDRPEKDAVQWRGQQPPGPGPRKCWACGFTWILEEGQEDICPMCKRPNVIKEIDPLDIRYVIKEQPYLQPDFTRQLQHDASPEEEIKRSKNLLRSPGETELTVGDISIVKEKQRKINQQWNQKSVNREGDVSIGDLSIIQESSKRLDELYEGRKASDFKPHVSLSQQIINEHIQDFKEKQYKKILLREAMHKLISEKG
jgi:hypothetical protein